MTKYFVIGYNKTATATFYEIFSENNIKSQHAKSNKWNTKKYDAFSDIQSNDLIWKDYYNMYKDAFFILNVRSLESWLVSRLKHKLRNGEKMTIFEMEKQCKDWIFKRQRYYLNILNFFKKNPNKLIIVNIEEHDWVNYICLLFNFRNKNITSKNVKETDSDNKHKQIILAINKVFKILRYNNYESKNILFKDEKLSKMYLNLYRNNITKKN